MNIEIKKGIASGRIKAPPSKSYAHRLLISAALANGKSKISGIINSVDMQATLDCISALGVEYARDGEEVSVLGGKFNNFHRSFNCHESGSTLRFFIPIALALTDNAKFIGAKRLIERGITAYEEIFSKKGITVEKTQNEINLSGRLTAGEYHISGNVSSQFISGLIFALPLLSGDSKIVITTELESEAYVDVTIEAVKCFGIQINRQGNEIFIKGNQSYQPREISVEGDASNSAFLDAFNYLGGDVSVLGINEKTIQPDYVYKSYFEKLNNENPTLSLKNCPDLGPVCFMLAALKNGATFKDTKRLAIKESDRAMAMKEELSKLGARVDVFENEAVVYKTENLKENMELSCHNDHRIAMALAVSLSTLGGTLKDCECVSKSYPHFFEDLKSLGIICKEI